MTAFINLFILVTIAFISAPAHAQPTNTFTNVTIHASQLQRATDARTEITIELAASLNLDHIRRYRTITIAHQTIPFVKSGAFKSLHNLNTLTIGPNKIYSLESGSFADLPNLKELHVNGNLITKLGYAVFDCSALEVFDAHDNLVMVVDDRVFDFLPRVRKIDMSSNRIKQIAPRWFLNTPDLYEIVLANNRIAEIPSDAFAHLRGTRLFGSAAFVRPNVYLSANRVKTVRRGAFRGKRLGDLFLDGNEIEGLEGAFEGCDGINWLDLTLNRIECLKPTEGLFVANVTHLDRNPWDCGCLQTVLEKAKQLRKRAFANSVQISCLQMS